MASPWQFRLSKLDDSLQPFQSNLGRLQACLEVSHAELSRSLEEAQQNAAALHHLILAERPDLSWSDRGSLEQVIQQLEAAAREQENQRRRYKLLHLAKELEAGTVRHRVEVRTTALNTLRLEAVAELRNAAQSAEQALELPGPDASEWLPWAAFLEEERDATIVAYLRHDYPVLERFAGELEERYWNPVIRPESQVKASTERVPTPLGQSAAAASAATVSSSATTTAPAMSETPVNSTVNMFNVPSRQRPSRNGEAPALPPTVVGPSIAETAATQPAPVELHFVDASADLPMDAMPSFGVLTQTRRPAAIWVAAVGGIALCAIFAGIYHSSAKASNTPGGTVTPKTDIPNPATAVPSPPFAKQAVEGTQHQMTLDLERCKRVNVDNVECWGYVSNMGTDSSRISLQTADVVDGKGNTFNLHGAGKLDFTTGQSSNIAGGARVKYTVTVPEKDPNAKTLTLYVDLTNPHQLEYTFRDVPIT